MSISYELACENCSKKYSLLISRPYLLLVLSVKLFENHKLTTIDFFRNHGNGLISVEFTLSTAQL